MNTVEQYRNSNYFNTWNTCEPLHEDSENPNVGYWTENSMKNYNTNMDLAHLSGYTGCNIDNERNLSQQPFNTLCFEVPRNNFENWHQTNNYPKLFDDDSLEELFKLCSESNNSNSEDNLSRKHNKNFPSNERYFASINGSQNIIEQYSLTVDSNSLEYTSSSTNYANGNNRSVIEHYAEFTKGRNYSKMQRTEDNSESSEVSSTTKASTNKRHRTAFTKSQLKYLNDVFTRSHYLTSGTIKSLAQCLGLTENTVKVWFQNKRANWKKQNRSHISKETWKCSQNRKLGKSDVRKLKSCKENLTNPPNNCNNLWACNEDWNHFIENPELNLKKNYTHIPPIENCQQAGSLCKFQKIQPETSFAYSFHYPANAYVN